jgi:pimeloyl-ACP methyl ester carboxylesterase
MTALAALLLWSSLVGAVAPAPGASEGTVAVNGMEMFVRTVGSGEPLLVLHSGTQSGEMWEPFVAALGARYRVILPDLRGHGRSMNPDGLLTTRRFADDVAALLDQLGIRRCRAIGASAGGMTLLHLATRHPERLEAMVVVGVGTDLPEACRALLAPTSVDDLSEAAWQRLRARHRHGDDQIRALYAWVAGLAADTEDMKFTPAQLAAITTPTLIVHGDRDYCFPASMAWEIHQAVPTSYLWVVPNGSHVPLAGSNADTFAATVLEFFSGAWPTR